MLEQNGVHVAAISYDSQQVLQQFAQRYSIGFPLLSDRGSAVIRSFGIFNSNIAPDLRSYGVPHPVSYLLAPDGVVVRKYFVPNYQHRVAASAVALAEFGAAGAPTITIRSGPLTVLIALSSETAFAGQELRYQAKFLLDTGWHVYAPPLPPSYTPLSLIFDDTNVIAQSLDLPRAERVEIPVLCESLPVYSGEFRGTGKLLLKFPMAEGAAAVSGELRFQSCTDTVCEPPQAVKFQVPLTIGRFVKAE